MQKPPTQSGSIVAPANPGTTPKFSPGAPGTAPLTPTSAASPNPGAPVPKASHADLYRTIAIIILSILTVTFLGLFVWKYAEWDTVKTNVDGQIDAAVAIAVSENTTKLENEFVEREKYPYKSFAGPADYGSFSFEYPKTWNLYISSDAANGGNYGAYFNPGEIQPITNTSVFALRVAILDSAFDKEVSRYDSLIQKGQLSLNTRNVGSALANVYTGWLSNNIQGILTVFKVRDKTVMIQTDSLLFSEEYYKLLDTVTFVE